MKPRYKPNIVVSVNESIEDFSHDRSLKLFMLVGKIVNVTVDNDMT